MICIDFIRIIFIINNRIPPLKEIIKLSNEVYFGSLVWLHKKLRKAFPRENV